MKRSAIVALIVFLAIPPGALAQSCTGNPVTVQILGSGGPAINPTRASSSYLLWVESQAKMLVDMGGGAFLRFGQSQAKQSDLSLVAVSHLHPDHISDLPAFLWLSNQNRKEPLPIVGPTGTSDVPAFQTFLTRLFDSKEGAFQVLSTALGGPPVAGAGGGVRLEVGIADTAKAEPSVVFDKDGLKVTAFGIPHGPIPALAYRVEARGVSVVFSTDQNGTTRSSSISPKEQMC